MARRLIDRLIGGDEITMSSVSLAAMSQPPLQILDVLGEPVAPLPLSSSEVRRLYEAMATARVFDRKCSALQRQGRLATYAQFEGQEAAQIGAVASLEAKDWLVGSYRDAAAQWFHGFSWRNLILGRTGDERGGRSPDGAEVLPPSITVGGHMIHAVGLAWAEKLQGSDAVYDLPTIFVCQNNGWAISLPTSRQTRAAALADKAIGYGMPGVRVDGNDVLAVYAAGRDAVERARAGEGPTFIEALTYRMGAHTTADDHHRYRSRGDVEDWRTRDPLERVRRFLTADGGWSQEWQDEIDDRATAEVEKAVAAAEDLEPLEIDDLFDSMFAEAPAHLEDQRRMATGTSQP